MKSLYLATILVMSVASASPALALPKNYPAHFKCTSEVTSTVMEGVLPEKPKLFEFGGAPQSTVFALNGIAGETEYYLNKKCFISRANEQICHTSNEIQFKLKAEVTMPNGYNATQFNGHITVYDDVSFLHIIAVEPGFGWYDNLKCNWNN